MIAAARIRPVLSRPGETWSIDQAAHYAGRDRKTVTSWCRRHGIGRQAGERAPWEVNRIALEMVIHGDFDALELLRCGKRSHPDVAIYFDHVGLPI